MKRQDLVDIVNSHEFVKFEQIRRYFPNLNICNQGIVRVISPEIEITSFTAYCDDGFVKLTGMTKGFDQWSDFGIGYIKAELIEI